MTHVSRAEFDRIRKAAEERKAKRAEKRTALQKASGKPRRRSLAAEKKSLDELCSLVVRRRDAARTRGLCVFGCGRPIECAFHFVRKSRSLRLRYDLRNVVGACTACNGYMEHNEGPFWTWYARTYGVEQMEALQRDSHGVTRAVRTFLATTRANLTAIWEKGDIA